MEIERIPEPLLISCMDGYGITSIDIVKFSQEDWRLTSARALVSIRECALKEGFQLLESGAVPFAGAETGSEESAGAGNYIIGIFCCLISIEFLFWCLHRKSRQKHNWEEDRYTR